MRFHLLPNSHLDPVWLWDWAEGLNEGITTCRTVVALMRVYPELTYLRGETSIYAHLERYDPATLDAIRGLIAAGRWDVVGGTVCQPDTNLPATETLCRQFTVGLPYLEKTLGTRPTVAWAADSFGHAHGWPEIYAEAGMESFAFSRPIQADCPLPGPAFWWRSQSGRRILCWRMPVGWYGTDRGELIPRLDAFRAQAATWGLENVAVFFGLGNHGGGPTAREIEEVLRWRDTQPDLSVEFSTPHRFFAALRAESAALPVIDRELNFTLRGCYSSAARYKFAYRRTENLLLAAERTATAVAATLGTPPPDLREAWQSVLFNTFHDILPGSAIERAFDEQLAWLGLADHHARAARLDALNTLAARVDTRVPPPPADHPSAVPVLLWNPHPRPFSGCIDFEANLDYRPIGAYRDRPDALPVSLRDTRGRPHPFQLAPIESHFTTQTPWRKRFVTPVNLPAFGWTVLRAAWEEGAPPPPAPAAAAITRTRGTSGIANAHFSINATPGRDGIALSLDRTPLFGRRGLQLISCDDPYGSWGDHDGDTAANDTSVVVAHWTVARTQILERGPHRAALWVELLAGRSRVELTFTLDGGARAVHVAARVFWADRSTRLKLVMAGGDRAEYEVPGGTVHRGPLGEVPGGRWVRVSGPRRAWLFASDALYNFDAKAGALRATIVRSSRYAWNATSGADVEPWRPHTDLGEHRFNFTLGAADLDPWELADRLEAPVVALPTHPHAPASPPPASLFALGPGLRLLALKPAETAPGFVVRIQVTAGRPTPVTIKIARHTLRLGREPAGRIATWHLTPGDSGWSATRINAAEEPV